jgi:flagellar biosynthesis protein FlhB
MRQNNIITLILFVLIFVIHLINEYENYYSDIYDKLSNTEDVIEKEEMRDEIERYKKLIINLRNILKIITIITITIAIVGLIVNYHMTRMKGGSFSSLKFILGDVKCASE